MFNPAKVEVAVFWVNAPRIVVEDMAVNVPLMVVEPVLDMEKKVEVAPVFTIWKRSASCPLAERMTSGIELTAVPTVEVASIVKTALVKGEDVPTVNCLAVFPQKNLVSSPLNPPAPSLNCTAPILPPGVTPPVRAQMLFEEVQTLAPPSARAMLLVSPSHTFPLNVEVEFVPLTLMNPAKVEVAPMPLILIKEETEVEPVMSAPPA